MKKFSILLFLSLSFASVANAQTHITINCPSIGGVPYTQVLDSAGNYQCVPSSSQNGGTGSGAAAAPANTNPCANGGTLNANGVCNLGYVPLEPIPGITPTNGVYDLTSPGGFSKFINALFTILISIGALLAVVSLTIGGIQYMTASSIGNKTRGLDQARGAIYGLLIIAATWLILNTINPHLLNFDFIACQGGGGSTVCTSTAAVNPANTNGPSTAIDQALSAGQTLTPEQTTQVLGSTAQTPQNCAEMQQLVNSHDTSIVQIFYDYAKSVKYGLTNVQSNIDAERQFVNSCNNVNSGAAGI